MFSSKKIYYFITSLCFFTTTPLDADNTPGEKKPLEIKVKETPFKPNKRQMHEKKDQAQEISNKKIYSRTARIHKKNIEIKNPTTLENNIKNPINQSQENVIVKNQITLHKKIARHHKKTTHEEKKSENAAIPTSISSDVKTTDSDKQNISTIQPPTQKITTKNTDSRIE